MGPKSKSFVGVRCCFKVVIQLCSSCLGERKIEKAVAGFGLFGSLGCNLLLY